MMNPNQEKRVRRRLPTTISEEEFQQLFEATKKPHHKLAFALGFYQAMRVSEVVNLRPENIDKGRKMIHIIQAKGGKDRDIPIAPQILRGLNKLPIKCGIRALQTIFKKNTNEILKRDLNFHCLRHSGASYLLNDKGWDIRQVQQFLGHARISTTEIYLHVSPKNLVDKMWENIEK